MVSFLFFEFILFELIDSALYCIELWRVVHLSSLVGFEPFKEDL